MNRLTEQEKMDRRNARFNEANNSLTLLKKTLDFIESKRIKGMFYDSEIVLPIGSIKTSIEKLEKRIKRYNQQDK